jgi:two-component system, NtrC family, response regulator AtoC
MMPAILIIEDETILGKNVKTYLERHGFEARVSQSAEAGLAALDEFSPDIVLLDYNLPGMNGLELLGELKRRDPGANVVMLTGHGSVQIAVEAMKLGAADFLGKPIALDELKLVLERVLSQRRIEGALAYYRARQAETSGVARLLGSSPPMIALKQKLAQLIHAEQGMREGAAPAVLIHGETGTGKELVARALHFDGVRHARPFVELNCASIPASLLEAELFGYERGAFTDARQRKAGLVEAAEGGTLFLDEIGEVDIAIQAKLLKLLEDRTVRRLGGLREQTVDVRFVAATNRDLEQMVREGRFRADLFFRLRIVDVVIPPLRARADDVLLLAQTFLKEHGARYGKPNLRLSGSAEKALTNYAWPGNVRELRNAVEQAVLLAVRDVIEASQFPFCESLASGPAAAPAAAADAVSRPALPDSGVNLGDVERDLVVQALERTGWNVTRAAQLLGVSRDTLRYRMEKHRIRPSA